jgi:hypothetical protein
VRHIARCAALLVILSSLVWQVHAQEIVTLVKRSGMKPSGIGKAFSVWYEIRTEPAPDGYILQSSSLALEGDRRCGAWAECKLLRSDTMSATWAFSLQGHDEDFFKKPRESEGVLTAVFVKQPLTDPFSKNEVTGYYWSARGKSFGCADTPEHATASMPNAGPWCSVSAPPAPDGFVLTGVSFRLEGDRSCAGDDKHPTGAGSYAECKQTARSDKTATWIFRMQGHDEIRETVPVLGGTRSVLAARQSRGIVVATYSRKK